MIMELKEFWTYYDVDKHQEEKAYVGNKQQIRLFMQLCYPSQQMTILTA